MLPVMRKGTSALPVRKRMPACGKHIACRIAVVDGVELDLEGLLALLGLMVLMMRKLVGDLKILVVQLIF